MRRLSFAFLGLLLACGGSSRDGSSPRGFDEFAWQSDEPDTRTERLCVEAAAPDQASETTFIDCEVEGATFAPPGTPAPRDELVVVAWNILRGFEAEEQVELLSAAAFAPPPDVLLLSEVDRGCARTDFRNVARDYARALGFYYVYATEFVELPGERGLTGPYDPPICEHGNAIVSRYPLGNVVQIRHARNESWYTPPDFPDPDEPRLGGRIALRADANVNGRLVRLYVLHLESRLTALQVRDAQAEEIALDALESPHPVIVGGDFNAYAARFDIENDTTNDKPTQSFLARGFADVHAGLDPSTRITSLDSDLVIDFLFARGAEVRSAGLCSAELCERLSDHLPVWGVLTLP